jgi:hypothetical protein
MWRSYVTAMKFRSAEITPTNSVRGLASSRLGQGGVAAPIKKCREATVAGADGAVRSSHRFNRKLNEPPRPLHTMRLRVIFLDVASTPPWPRRGLPLLQTDPTTAIRHSLNSGTKTLKSAPEASSKINRSTRYRRDRCSEGPGSFYLRWP